MRPILVALFLLMATAAQADTKGLIAVLPLAETGGTKLSPGQREFLEDTIRTQTAVKLSARGYTVLTGESTLRVLPENGVDPAKTCDANCALNAANELKASYFLSGSVYFVDDDYVVELRMSETTAGRMLGSVRLQAKKVSALTDDFSAKSDGFFAQALAGAEESNGQVTSVATPRAVVAEPESGGDSTELASTVEISAFSTLGEILTGARIFVDGRLESTVPRSLRMPPGDHVIRVGKELHLAKTMNVSLTAGDSQRIDFELKADFGQLDITTEPPGASVTIDGSRVGTAPLKDVRLKTGKHLVAVEKNGYFPMSRQVVVKEGQQPELALEGDFGPLMVESRPAGAVVIVDGVVVGNTPLNLPRVISGKHALQLKVDPLAYEEWRGDVLVVRGAGAKMTDIVLTRREADVVITSQPPTSACWSTTWTSARRARSSGRSGATAG